MRNLLLLVVLPVLFILSCLLATDDKTDITYDFFEIPDIEDGFSGTTYYVASDGNDDNLGTEDLPWKTIQKAAETLEKGERVYVKEGVYDEKIEVQNSGEEGNPVIFASYPGDEVIIDCTDISISSWSGCISIHNKNYIVINGFKTINSGQCGIFANYCNNILIKNNYSYNTYSSGVGVWFSTNVVVDNNEVVLACNDGDQECISVAGCDTFIIRNNHVHDSGPGTHGGEGIDAKHGMNGLVHNNQVHDMNRLGIYVDSWDTHTYNISVFNNITYNCDSVGIAVAAEDGGILENIKIFNNIVYDNPWTGIVVAAWGEDVPAHPIKNIAIINNTIVRNGVGWGGGILIEENNHVEQIFINNNIISNNLSYQVVSDVSMNKLDVSYNLIDGYGGTENEILGSNYIRDDPDFINAANNDFHITADSPAVNAGLDEYSPPFDYEDRSRPINGNCDIGAFEYSDK